MKKLARILAVASLSLAALQASAAVIIDNNTTGRYNNGIGTLLNTAGPTDPFCSTGCTDGTFNYPTEPNLSAAAAALGNWLSTPATPGGSWSGTGTVIPLSWAVNTETAIIYEINAGTGLVNLLLRLGADNGIFVWLDGNYLFGARAAGGAALGEYSLNLPDLTGTHYLQILREDHGGATGYAIDLAADRQVVNPAPAPGVLALLGLGFAGLGFARKRG